MVLLKEENNEKQSMVQSIDGIKQSQNTITNNIARMAQMMKQVLTKNQYLESVIADRYTNNGINQKLGRQ